MQPEEMSAQMQRAVAALRAGKPGETRDIVAAVVREGIDDASVWGVLAIACRDLGQMSDAQQAADRSIALEPRNPRAFVVKADAYFATGDRRAAAAFYRDALKHSPPLAQCPSDMRPEVERAISRVASLQEEFSRHLSAHVGGYIESADEDRTRMTQAVDLLLGRRQTYYPEPHHLLFPGLPVREFYDPQDFPWVPEVEAATPDIQRELATLLQEGADFGAYVTGDDDRPEYDTHGMKGNKSWGAFYLWYNGEAVAENQARCPVTTAVMEKVPLVFSGKRCPNVLFSRLKAGATIPPHTGMVNTRLICHLPLIVPGHCGFRVGNDVREWEKGKVWMFDDTIEHEAWNRSSDDRIILLFEIWKPELSEAEQGLVTRLLEAVDSY